ncbi:MAG: Uncharacterised protein [Methanobacteriota archaeon]|nr:MAG: Uncharacterised protein [Euryarchaeota archaeon]
MLASISHDSPVTGIVRICGISVATFDAYTVISKLSQISSSPAPIHNDNVVLDDSPRVVEPGTSKSIRNSLVEEGSNSTFHCSTPL